MVEEEKFSGRSQRKINKKSACDKEKKKKKDLVRGKFQNRLILSAYWLDVIILGLTLTLKFVPFFVDIY